MGHDRARAAATGGAERGRRVVAALIALCTAWALLGILPHATAAGTRVEGTVVLPPEFVSDALVVEPLSWQRDPEDGQFSWAPVDFDPEYRITGSSFVLTLPAGTYVLRFYDLNSAGADVFHPNAATASQATPVVVGASTVTLSPVTMVPFGSISGLVTVPPAFRSDTVTAQAWRVLPGGELAAGEPESASVQHDPEAPAEGPYRIEGLRAGRYLVQFTSSDIGLAGGWFAGPRLALGLWHDTAAQVTVGAGADVDEIDGNLELGGRFSGWAVDADGGSLGEDLRVEAYAEGAGVVDPEPVLSVPVERDGTWELPGLQAGRYRIGVVDPSGEWLPAYHASAATVGEAALVSVLAGTVHSGFVLRAERAGVIQGRVSVANGRSAGEVRVVLHQREPGKAAWRPVAEAWPSVDGAYRIGRLRPGAYRVGFVDEVAGGGLRFHPGVATVESARDVVIAAGTRTHEVSVDLSVPLAVVPGVTTPPAGPEPTPSPSGAPVPSLPSASPSAGSSTPPVLPVPPGPVGGVGGPSPTAAPAPVVRVLSHPKITGKTRVGQKVTVTKGRYAPAKVTVRYAWFVRKGPGKASVKVAKATRASLRLSKKWRSRQVRVRITVSAPGHAPRVLTSSWSKRIKR